MTDRPWRRFSDGGVKSDGTIRTALRFVFAKGKRVIPSQSNGRSADGDSRRFELLYGAIVGDTALQRNGRSGFQGTNAYFEEVGGTLQTHSGQIHTDLEIPLERIGVCTRQLRFGLGTILPAHDSNSSYPRSGKVASIVTRTNLVLHKGSPIPAWIDPAL